MKQQIAAYTASGATYPEYINVSCNDSGAYEITIREQVNLDGEYPKEGRTVMITLSENVMMSFLDEINEKF